jgi:Rrf2 family transcriptional regulator, iron-sulfur cluster assembly transcription factor
MKFLNLLLIIYKIFSKLGNYFHNFFFIMSVFLSKSCEYGLQAILYLSHKSSAEPLTLHDIADNLNVPRHFLSKILQSLARDGIVVSHRGIKGGFLLAKPAGEITINDLIQSIDGTEFMNECILGFPGCGSDSPCPVHETWKSAKELLLDVFQRKTVEELSKSLGSKLNYIKQSPRDNSR